MTVTEHFGFDMLSAPVNAVDRRALSQAWYTALYATRNAAPASRPRTSATLSRSEPSPEAIVRGAVGNAPVRPAPAPARRPGEALAGAAGADERRAPRFPLARSIERVLGRYARPPRRASFTLGGGEGRVHVVLQTDGAKMRLIAFCTPKARRRVAAALQQVRFDLASRGFNVQATLGDDL